MALRQAVFYPLGESAALLFTAGFAHSVHTLITALNSPGATLSVALYVYAKEQGEFEIAFAIALILIVLTLGINLIISLLQKHLKKRTNL